MFSCAVDFGFLNEPELHRGHRAFCFGNKIDVFDGAFIESNRPVRIIMSDWCCDIKAVRQLHINRNICVCAVTRQRIHSENHECHCPQECLDIKDAVALFTSKAAYLTFEENKKGTIEVGKYADLVVLSDDIFQIDAQKIQDVAVLKTMVNGEFVFSKE